MTKRIGLLAIGVLMMFSGGLKGQGVVSPCPEVLIDQKYDHVGSFRYRQKGWDTVVTCNTTTLELSSEPYIPVQYFNGTYTVESVPYNPPDTSFHGGTHLDVTSDDYYCSSVTTIPFPFFFFGIEKTGFVCGSNSIMTFDQTAANQSCPWSMSASQTIPWQRTSEHLNDAILGIYEDTDLRTSYNNQAAPYYRGAWYGIQGVWPCRKIICSWNDVTTYNGSSNDANRCSYQMVCYEGSNIIEVHVKKRSLDGGGSGTWNGLRGILGIINATGQPQQPGSMGQPNMFVQSGSPACFYPAGFNHTTSAYQQIAYRFTPQGSTFTTCEWYRLMSNGDSILLTTNQMDTNGYYMPMNQNDPVHPTLTKAYVSPTCVSRYMLKLKFKNAKGDWYNLYDTITIGVDTAKGMELVHPAEPVGRHEHEICAGENTSVSLSVPENQPVKRVTWTVSRTLNGVNTALPPTMYIISGDQMSCTLRPDPQADTLPLNKIDSVRVQAFVEFMSECTNYDTFMIRVFPNFDTTEYEGICQGEKFKWHLNNQTYTQTTTAPQVTLQSVPGCDSVVHLNLTVSDVSLTVDTVSDCKPVRWINGKTYTTSNTATYESDTIVLQNRWGCDSTVRLHLTIHPLTARMESNLKEFDLDHLDVILTDLSTGSDGRRWIFPTGPEQTSPTAYYSVPASLNSADIMLIAHSPYGCVDTTNLVIPFNKETFWIPNIFTPGDPTSNNYFSSVSANTLKEEMFIYNRHGELVFHCEGVDCPWDGRDLNGNPCIQGAYVYIIRYNNTFEPTKTITRHGTVTLIR